MDDGVIKLDELAFMGNELWAMSCERFDTKLFNDFKL